MGTTSRLLYSVSRVAQHIISNDSITPAYWAYQLSSLLYEEERAWLQVEEDLEMMSFSACSVTSIWRSPVPSLATTESIF